MLTGAEPKAINKLAVAIREWLKEKFSAPGSFGGLTYVEIADDEEGSPAEAPEAGITGADTAADADGRIFLQRVP